MNGASDLFMEVFGEAGRHTRMAVGVNALPYNVAVGVEGVFEVSSRIKFNESTRQRGRPGER